MKNVTLILAMGMALSTLGVAQTTKPTTKPPTKPDNKATKGTVQMAGDNGKLNTTYTIGKIDPINITLTNVRFSVVRETMGKDIVAPAKDEKLLVIDFTAHNPNPKEISFNGGSLKFTGVDQESVNRDYRYHFMRAKTGEIFNTELKPAQKVELRTVIVVPAAGTVPKLILEHRTGGPVLRVDLKPYLKPMEAPFADPKDETGMTVLETIKAQNDTYYPLGMIDIKLNTQTLAKHGGKFGPNTTGAGRGYASVKFNFKGQSPMPAFVRFSAEFVDEDGGKHPVVKWAPPSTEEHFNQRLELDEEVGIRFVAVIPDSVKIKEIRVTDTALGKPSRTYVFPVTTGN
jgi:hypothetical protein